MTEEQTVLDTGVSAAEANERALAGDYDQRIWSSFETGPQGLTDEQVGILMSPLKSGRVKSRDQGGNQVSYLEAWDLKASLIRIFGFGGFSSEVIESEIIQIREASTHPGHVQPKDSPYKGQDGQPKFRKGDPRTPQAIAKATVRITIPALDCAFTESAVGSEYSNDIGDACDNAIKTAESDAFKRCVVFLGTQFGLGLYDSGSFNEVVRAIYEPGQKAQLEAWRKTQADPREHADGNLGRALGATREGQS